MDYLCESIPTLYSKMEAVAGNLWVYKDTQQCLTALHKYQESILKGSRMGGTPLDWILQSKLVPQMVEAKEIHERFPFMSQWMSCDDLDGERLKGQLLYCNTDFTADARKFCVHLLETARESDKVEVLFNESVIGFDTVADEVVAVRTSTGKRIEADSVVVCCGLATNEVIKQVMSSFTGPLPLEGMRGYTFELFEVKNAPNVCVSDYGSASLNFQFTPFYEGRARVTSFAQFDSRIDVPVEEVSACQEVALKHLRKVLPEVTYESMGDMWSGIRPMSPDNMPMIGRLTGTPSNLYVNCGHGSNGWTLAAASAVLVRDLVTPDPDTATPQVRKDLALSLSPDRFQPLACFKK